MNTHGEPTSQVLRALTVQIAKSRLQRVPVVVTRARRGRKASKTVLRELTRIDANDGQEKTRL